MKLGINTLCSYCNFYESDNNYVLGKHEANCWANPKASGKNNTNWYCQICETRFMTNKNLRSHNKGLHDVKKIQKCKHCTKSWTTTDKLRLLHENRCPQNNNSIKYKCRFCSRKALSHLKNNKHEVECIFNPTNPELENISFNPINENSMNNIGIYKITTPTNKVYIGMTAESFEKRWGGHLKKLMAGKHHCSGLQKAYNKYGWEAISKEIIEEYKPDLSFNKEYLNAFLLKREKEIWNNYTKNYNMLNGEPSGRGAVVHTEETRRKISETHKRRFEENRTYGEYCKVYFLKCKNINCNKIFCSKKNDKKYCSNACRKLMFTRASNSKNIKRTSVYSICYNNLCCNYCLLKYCSDYCKNNKFLKISKEIEFLYNDEKLTVREIADKLGITHTTVINRMKTFNIPARSQKESLIINKIKNNFSKEQLYNWHVNENMSILEIAKIYNENSKLVKDALDFYGILKNVG